MTVPHAGPCRAYLAAFGFGWVLVALAACNTESAIPTSPSSRLLLSRDSVTLEIGDTATIRARAATGAQWVDDAVIAWSSSGPTVASVSSTGFVTGISAGTATITARFGAISRSAHVQVLGPVTRIVVNQASIDVIPGWATQLVAVGEDATGHQRPVSITWESSDSSVVRPPNSDYLLGGRVGRATLTARSGNVSATVAAVVRPREGVLTLLASSTLFDLALDGSPPVRWPIQPTRLPNVSYSGFDWSQTGRLLYVCGDASVCLVAPAGPTEVVTVPVTRVFGPTWWPDNRRIVYAFEGGAQIFDPATRGVEVIPATERPYSIRVAPNGTSLAFVNLDDDYDTSAWVKDANGIRRIPGFYCSDVDWSPDGTRLAAVCENEVYRENNGNPDGAFSLPASARQVRWDPSGHLLAFLNVSSSVLSLSNPDGTGRMVWPGESYAVYDIETFAWRRP